MECRRVAHYITPQYPTRDYLIEHPELLKGVPERWRKNRLVLTVLSMVVPLILARQTAAGETRSTKPTTVRVAPLFIHGDGRGAFGCVVVNPPVFLSEDEARQVVQDEARKAGIEFETDQITLKGVMVPVTDQFGFREEREKQQKNRELKPGLRERDLTLDGYDKKHKVAYEFVSAQDFAEWEENKDRSSWNSVSSYDFMTTAEKLAQGFDNVKGEPVVAVFYEPGASAPEVARTNRTPVASEWTATWEARKKAARELGAKELREQVQGFVQWLKAQGVI